MTKKKTKIITKKPPKKKAKKKAGRKWFNGRDISEVVMQCQEVWAVGGSDSEASYYANITKQTLSKFLQAFPEIVELRDRLQEKPILLARRTLMNAMQYDGKLALNFLERKKNKEFSLKSEVDNKEIPVVNIVLGDHKPNGKKK